jgi:hypothetical protein
MTDVKYLIEPTEAPNPQIPKGKIVEVSIIDKYSGDDTHGHHSLIHIVVRGCIFLPLI